MQDNINPKWRYLVDFISTPQGATPLATLCSYPAYLSLSLTNRWGVTRGVDGMGGGGNAPCTRLW